MNRTRIGTLRLGSAPARIAAALVVLTAGLAANAAPAQAGVVCQGSTKLEQYWVTWTQSTSVTFQWPPGTGTFLLGDYNGYEAASSYATDYRTVSQYHTSGGTLYVTQSVYSPGTRGSKSGNLNVVWC